MDFSQFNAAEQAHMSKVVEKRQFQDFLKMYAVITERCFTTCCNDFTSKSLSAKESQCISNCTDKFIKHSDRAGTRYTEVGAEIANAPQNPS